MRNIISRLFVIFRRRLFRMLWLFNEKILRIRPKLIILCYHNISDQGRRFDISLKDLQEQVDYLISQFQPAALTEIYESLHNDKPLARPSFAVTFDDGYANTLKAIEFFKSRNIKPAVFVSSQAESIQISKQNYLSIDEIIKLRAAGWEIGCHGATHKDLTELSSVEMNKEIIGAKIKLEKELGFTIDYFAYPHGRYNNDVLRIVKQADFKLAFAMSEQGVKSGDNPLALPRIGVDENFCLDDFKAIISPAVIKLRRIIQRLGLDRFNNFFVKAYPDIGVHSGHASGKNMKFNKYHFIALFKKINEYLLSGFKKGVKLIHKMRDFASGRPSTRTFLKFFQLEKILFSGIFFIIILSLVLGLAIRGSPGNPDSTEIISNKWMEDGPFELSPERGRYALLYSIVEDKSLHFSLPLARFAMPDLGLSPDGQYTSLFTPGVSIIAIPGYWLGKRLGIAQIGSYAIIALFALLNAVLIRLIARALGAAPSAANLGALVYLCATPALAYAVSFYQHQISVFIMLLCIFLLISRNNWQSLAAVWFLLSFSVIVDNPNFFLLFPLGIYALSKIIGFSRHGRFTSINLWPAGWAACAIIVLPIVMLLLYNQASHGDPMRLSGTLPAVKTIDSDGQPQFLNIDNNSAGNDVQLPHQESDKSALGFFQTRNLLNGFYIHFLSPDRGVIRYAPVILLGILGLIALYKRNAGAANLFVGMAGMNVILYSMWGDPYGGWAFGSRYLIPSYALLGIGLAIALNKWRRNLLFISIFLCLFGYSVWVNTLGAITSNANPPKIEILALEEKTGREEKYTYARNQQFLEEKGSKSFIWLVIGRKHITAEHYHKLLAGFIFIIGLSWFLCLWKEKKIKINSNNEHG